MIQKKQQALWVFIRIVRIILIVAALYIGGIMLMKWFINSGVTNAESSVIVESTGSTNIPADNWQVHKYIKENPLDKFAVEEAYTYFNGTGSNKEWFPENNGGLDFVIKGIDNRKEFTESLYYWSDLLGIDKDMSLACVLGEQIRIANKGARGKLKDIIISSTPKLLRSYNISLGIGGIKFETAQKIRDQACKYWYGDDFMRDEICNDVITSTGLANNDAFNAKYAAYNVFNIIEKRKRAGYDISKNPGVVCTLYNIGNEEKEPNANPKIGGSVIRIGDRNYVYGGISRGVYRYLKIFQ